MDSATACKERHDGMSSALYADDGWNALSDACRYDSWWIVSSCWLTYRSSCFPAAGNKKDDFPSQKTSPAARQLNDIKQITVYGTL